MLANSRPKTITVILSMLVLLAVVSAVSTATQRIGFGNARGNRPTAGLGTGQPGGNNGTGTGTGTGQQGNGNFQGGGGNFQNRGPAGGGFNMFTILRMFGLGPQALIYINIAIPVIGILLLLGSAYGIWKQKIWGLNLATVLGLLFLVAGLPALFSIGGRNINWLRIGLNALSVVATLPILALSFLPSVRDYFPKPAPKPRTVR
jgi:hypothetical protein